MCLNGFDSGSCYLNATESSPAKTSLGARGRLPRKPLVARTTDPFSNMLNLSSETIGFTSHRTHYPLEIEGLSRLSNTRGSNTDRLAA